MPGILLSTTTTMKKCFSCVLSLMLMLAACDSAKEVRPEQPTGPTKPYKATNYQNPVINSSCPDPTVLKAKDGFFYLYATEDDYNIPIYKSKDLVNWTLVGHVFTDTTRPEIGRAHV